MSPLAMRTELRQQEPEAVPTNEGAQQVDAVRGWNLSLERVADRRLSASVDEEIAGGKRHVWTVRKPRLTESPIYGFRDGQERRSRGLDHGAPVCLTLHRVDQQFENAIAHKDLLIEPFVLGKCSQDAIEHAVYVPREDVVRVDRIKRRLLDAYGVQVQRAESR